MRVPGIVFASRSLLPDEHEDMALAQVATVATLPGIVRASYAMPDVHWGYGFPIGGVAATDIDADGVVSPGGVGFDISCGVRLLVSRELDRDRLQPRIRAVMDHLDVAIPRGVGTKGVWRLPNRGVLKQVLAGGARFAVEQGHGVARGRKAVRRRRRSGRSRPGHGQRPGVRTRACAARQPGLGQPLPRSAGRGPDLRRGRGRAHGTVRGQDLCDDPYRLAGSRSPDLHRSRPADGTGHGPLRHPRARSPVGLCARSLSRGPGLRNRPVARHRRAR